MTATYDIRLLPDFQCPACGVSTPIMRYISVMQSSGVRIASAKGANTEFRHRVGDSWFVATLKCGNCAKEFELELRSK